MLLRACSCSESARFLSSAHEKKAGSRGDFQPDRRGKFSKTVRGIYEEKKRSGEGQGKKKKMRRRKREDEDESEECDHNGVEEHRSHLHGCISRFCRAGVFTCSHE